MKSDDPTIDYSPLHEPVTQEDVAAYVEKHPQTPFTRRQVITNTLIATVAAFIWASAIGNAQQSDPLTAIPLFGNMFGVVFFVILEIFILLAAFGVFKSDHKTEARSYKFALKNGMTYTRHSESVQSEAGLIFDNGDGRRLSDVYRLTRADLPIEIGNYQYSTGSGKNRQTHYYGFMRLGLKRHLPNMVLDAKANNQTLFGLTIDTGLSDRFERSQALSLEGDFDRHFTLYCPKEYEQDALYVFTPDLMALLIDETGSFDVEIVDTDLYIYQNKGFPINDEPTFRRLISIADIVGAKMDARTDYYADIRVGDRDNDTVTVEGRRLRKSLPWLRISIYVIVAVLFALSLIAANASHDQDVRDGSTIDTTDSQLQRYDSR